MLLRISAGALVVASVVAGFLIFGSPTAVRVAAQSAVESGCSLTKGPIQHVIYLQFDNTHFRRDTANVPSDLEQMPHLLGFLRDNGTLLTNDHTILISHTGGGIVASLTGLYPDRNGQAVSNSYGYFGPDKSVASSASFKYWTDVVDASGDPAPNMIGADGKTAPAPWVTYTRAGCDVGGVGVANVELENTNTTASGDMTKVFGANSPEWNEASATPPKAQADFVGIAVHCALASPLCVGGDSKPDLLPDEPGGYSGYSALFGAKYVNAHINAGQPVADTAGKPISDPAGNPGFPGFDGMSAAVTLGYVAKMQEAGVPVTYGYISDAHDAHPSGPAYGPGEAGYQVALQAYDTAFGAFFARLQADGISKANTLFVVTVDEGDHYAGGSGTSAPDGSLTWAHANCANLAACPTNQVGEVSLNIAAALPPGEPKFSVHSDTAPTVYVAGQPARTDPVVRKLERDISGLQPKDPYAGGNATVLTQGLADAVEERTLHMVTGDPNRTPTFTLFAQPDFFITTSAPACGANPCVDYRSAWDHGDIQDEIANTWAGMVGPGVQTLGVNSSIWSDHVDLRPTMLALLGLKDTYRTDGRPLVDLLSDSALPPAVRSSRDALSRLGDAYKALNAPFGAFAKATLSASTAALRSGSSADDGAYQTIEAQIDTLTQARDPLAARMRDQLSDAVFNAVPVDPSVVVDEVNQANALIAQAAAIPVPIVPPATGSGVLAAGTNASTVDEWLTLGAACALSALIRSAGRRVARNEHDGESRP